MKKLSKIIILIITFFCLCNIPIFSASIPSLNNDDEKEKSPITEEIDNIGIPENVQAFLNEYDISINDEGISGLTELSPEYFLNYILGIVKEKAVAPIRLMLNLIAIIFICAMIAGLSDTIKTGTISAVFSILTVVICIIAISKSLVLSFEEAKETLKTGGEFMLSFIPAYVATVAASGNISGATSFNMIVMIVSDFALYIANFVLVPLLSICFAVAIINAVNPNIKLGGIVDGVLKVITWGLGFIMSVFTGILSLQTVIGASANALEQKAAKFVVANAVPIIGGAVSDAYLTVKGSMNLLKSGVGSIGIITIVVIILPIILTLILYRFAVFVCKITADITDIEPLQDLFDKIGQIYNIIFSITVCFGLMFIISIGILFH